MPQAITHLAFARFAGTIGNTDPDAALDTRTTARGGSFNSAYETEEKQAGDSQSNRYQ